MAMSYEDRRQKIQTALDKKMPGMSCWLRATFEDAAVYECDGKLYRVPYTVNADEQDVELGEREMVEMTFEPVGEASVSLGQPIDETGMAWEVRVLRFGRSANGWLWTRESGEALLPHLHDAPVGLYVYKRGLESHAEPEAMAAAGGPLVRNIIAKIEAPRIAEDGVYGKLRVLEDSRWVATKLLALRQSGLLERAIGLSVDTLAGYVPVQLREGAAKWIKTIKRLIGVDIVTAPSADGRFIRATAGPLLFTEEDGMRDKLLALIRKHRPQLLEGRVTESLTEAQLEALVEEALKPPAAPAPGAPVDVGAITTEVQKSLEKRFAVRDTQELVRTLAGASTLPEIAQARLRKRFEGRVAEAAEIDAAIDEERRYLAKLSPSGEVRGFGAGRIVLVSESVDRLQVAMDRLFGIRPETPAGAALPGLDRVHEAYTPDTAHRVRESLAPAIKLHKDVGPEARFRSLQHAYVAITGDSELSFRFRVSEDITSATWANILGSTLNRSLLQNYAEQDYGERNIMRTGRAADFRNIEDTRMKYFGDIDTIEPETTDYQEIESVGDEKVTYAVIQKGNKLTITRKTIINDDLQSVQNLVQLFGRAFRRTLAQYVWNFWINNSAYDVDGVAWFHADHGNLGSTALSAATVETAITALMDMTEPGSSKKLGLPFSRGVRNLGLWLVVPNALWGTAKKENERELLAADMTMNPVRYMFGESSERIIVNPLLSDANDWGIFRDASDLPSIVVKFLQGREEPEFFLADAPTVGQMFTGDKLVYKGRHEYGGDIQDFRGAYKAVVA